MSLQLPDQPWPFFAPDEVEAATGVLTSGRVNYWTGTEGRDFEKEFADYVGTRRAIAVSNGTVSLQMAVRALGLGPGDEFVTSPRTYFASAAGPVLEGMKPVFADVDPDSGNITPESILAAWTPKTKLILPVHLGGWPCDMAGILALAESKNVPVLEDCAQAHGAFINGRSVGSFGAIGSWSFCQDKIITTGGEGGMITTNDETLWDAMWSFKDHGKSYQAVYHRAHPPGFRWLHEGWGTNFRMTDVQSAIGRIQLRKLEEWNRLRTRNAAILREHLSPLDVVRIPIPSEGMRHAYYRLYAYVEPGALAEGWNRDRIMAEANAAGVPTFVGSCGEIYLEKAIQDRGWAPSGRLPNAQLLTEQSLAFLTHPTLREETLHQWGSALAGVLKQAQR